MRSVAFTPNDIRARGEHVHDQSVDGCKSVVTSTVYYATHLLYLFSHRVMFRNVQSIEHVTVRIKLTSCNKTCISPTVVSPFFSFLVFFFSSLAYNSTSEIRPKANWPNPNFFLARSVIVRSRQRPQGPPPQGPPTGTATTLDHPPCAPHPVPHTLCPIPCTLLGDDAGNHSICVVCPPPVHACYQRVTKRYNAPSVTRDPSRLRCALNVAFPHKPVHGLRPKLVVLQTHCSHSLFVRCCGIVSDS